VLEAVACPDLASVIESGFPFDEALMSTVRGLCAPLREGGVDTVILGCTHYPLIAPMLQRMLGRDVTLVTSGLGVVRSAQRALAARDLLNPRTGEGRYAFRCTGAPERFARLGSRFLQMPLGTVTQVSVAPPLRETLAA
jgi:glutamate racemase